MRGDRLVDLAHASALTALESPAITTKSGVYAAWIVDDVALSEAGGDGPAPRLMYLGRAQTAAGLRGRLMEHARKPWYSLAELLAVRGHVLFPWWGRCMDKGSGYRPKRTPLAQVSEIQAVDWQRRNLVWTWEVAPFALVHDLELQLIRELKPFLNRASAERDLPQTRCGESYRRARTRWPWHISWAGALI